MKRLLIVGLLGVCVLLAPAACVMSLALASASITAASTDPACFSEEASAPSKCVPGWAATGSPHAPVVIDPGSIPAPDPASAAAVAAAVEAVGRRGRYIPEGNGPVDFDCSGLTSFAWRAAGVSLADYSFTQWNQTQRIPRAALAPGDLIFWFGGDVHHVAIVVAVNGSRVQIAEAANPDAGVRVRDFGDSWDTQYVSGFGRVTR